MSKVNYSRQQREILNNPEALAAIVGSHNRLTATFTHAGKTYRVVPFHAKPRSERTKVRRPAAKH